MELSLHDERLQLINGCTDLLSMGLNLGTWGNVSVINRKNGLVVITPSGVDYKSLKPEDLVIVNLNGDLVEGKLKPSIETGLHLEVYKTRDDVGAVAHTHSIFATAAAAARVPIPAVVEDMAQIIGGDVQVANYALPGTPELAVNAVKALESRNAVLLANHGAVGVGKNLKEAILACQVVEKTAQVYAYAKLFGNPVMLSQQDIEEMHSFYVNKYKQR